MLRTSRNCVDGAPVGGHRRPPAWSRDLAPARVERGPDRHAFGEVAEEDVGGSVRVAQYKVGDAGIEGHDTTVLGHRRSAARARSRSAREPHGYQRDGPRVAPPGENLARHSIEARV